MKIFGIARSERFSPNSAHRDEAVFRAVADVLRADGHEVETMSEDGIGSREELSRCCRASDAVFSMARDASLLSWLAAEEQAGCKVINSAVALLHADRSALTRLFITNDIPVPRTRPAAEAAGSLSFPLWLKRGDACAQSATDVCHAADRGEFEAAMASFAARGISDILACEHAAGDLVKFYGVEGTDFFFHYHATDGAHFSKFGLEKYNGAPAGYAVPTCLLKACADRAARLSGLTVYGGDCVVRRDGSFVIIDFNDWPSYSLCRDAAAAAIARRILQ